MQEDRVKWNTIYRNAKAISPQPCHVLERFECFLPTSGYALDIACGFGGNALMLSERGLATTAIDVSDVAIEQLGILAQQKSLQLQAVATPIENWFTALDADQKYDVIVVSRYLDRKLIPTIVSRMADNAIVYYQTFVKDKLEASVGPSNPAYLLDPNELLRLFDSLLVRAFYDAGSAGYSSLEIQNESYLVAQKVV